VAHVDVEDFSAYLDKFHRVYRETVEAHVPENLRGFLDRYSRLPCSVVGYVSTSFGVAFEYEPGDYDIRVAHSSARIEEFLTGAPAQVRKLQPMFRGFDIWGAWIEGLRLEGGFPFHLERTGSVTFVDVLFAARGWTRYVAYAEVFGTRDRDDWTDAKAIERAKEEVLSARTDIRTMDDENLSLSQFLAGQKEKSVLVAGDFSPEGRERLDAIRRALRQLGYVPRLLDDVPEVPELDLPEKFAAVAHMARFIVFDDSSASGHLREFHQAVESGLVTIVLRQGGSTPSYVTRADALKSTVIREFEYGGTTVHGVLAGATRWAEERIAELRSQRADLYPWRADAATEAETPAGDDEQT
jgi:hypothetical protein